MRHGLNGFWKLTWVETKVFVREPMGLIGTLFVPVLLYVVLGRTLRIDVPSQAVQVPFNLAILSALFIGISAAMSLVAIISIYREGGILKRLRATPLSPVTILGSHVVLKLAFTAVGLGLLVLAGRQSFPGAMQVNVASFTAAVLLSTFSILSMGFIIASIVPTARFAQPISAATLYPMVGMSGLFFPIDRLPPFLQIVAQGLPTTHAVALMQGVWDGAGWGAHLGDAGALVLIAAISVAISTKIFRWE
jgi:ABC-2 type transport system permease protein